MKNFMTKFLAFSCLALLVLASCKKDEVRTVAQPATGGALTASTTTPALSKSNLMETAITVTATTQNYGYTSAATNSLQIAVKGTAFASPTEVALATGALSKSYTVKDFNNLLLSLNLPSGKPAQLEMRVKSSLSATATEGTVYSNVVTVTATPFALVSYIYVPGAYQGWNPPTADSLQSANGNGVYTGIINFTPGNTGFKITPQKKWDVAYGDAGGGKISTSGANFASPGAGQYQITVDLNANTYTIEPVAVYYSIIGDATAGGWGSDTDMKYNNGTNIWEITASLASTGQFKVRKNHDWGTSYGVPKAGADGATLAKSDADNIPVASTGTYKFTFVLKGADDAKAAYTLVKQ
ncbi:SusE domain-containing protein [Mucilaginibacter sp. RB4R14]|uniref:SusE domain-containing protein n=1 Tax=Mucilaginibacter aurantiaciroseus TaxID=2949308 RepID=UPI002090227F|nr:SusE domain-containing protein [Mucilaginibacter aurantiaciroseus]MCO5936652.1 SusE domain-containing protein [Mucilaginibacter aurantiaciroseus]